MFFINSWFCVFYKTKFFSPFAFIGILAVLLRFAWFCRQGTKARSLFFFMFFFNPAEAQRRRVSFFYFVFSSEMVFSCRFFLLKTDGPSPYSPKDSGGNPFWGGVRPKKIEADSGNSFLLKTNSNF
ncbi:hypothetical protein [Flavobacterium sp. GSB-24]|uniref:hypothetical protein n=1 Tax=Flavobacterium sp. GSB-24 TaxID=2994319 RepID=UPI002492DCA8|nr:hypothetical protein [Flavobacterium sp. GSB-24]